MLDLKTKPEEEEEKDEDSDGTEMDTKIIDT